MIKPSTPDAQRISLAKRAFLSISTIHSVMHNPKVKHGHIPHWESLVMYLERAADVASNLERTSP